MEFSTSLCHNLQLMLSLFQKGHWNVIVAYSIQLYLYSICCFQHSPQCPLMKCKEIYFEFSNSSEHVKPCASRAGIIHFKLSQVNHESDFIWSAASVALHKMLGWWHNCCTLYHVGHNSESLHFNCGNRCKYILLFVTRAVKVTGPFHCFYPARAKQKTGLSSWLSLAVSIEEQLHFNWMLYFEHKSEHESENEPIV